MMLHPLLENWIHSKRWSLFDFQAEAISAYGAGESGLIQAPTGYGKTLSVFLAPLSQTLMQHGADLNEFQAKRLGCQVLWVTPLRALASDTLKSLRAPLDDLGLALAVDARTGDTSSYRRAKLRENLPYCLVTTPESLSLLLTYPDTREKLKSLQCVVFDEWHEMIGNKRGVQAELVLTRLRHWQPNLQTWALSATVGNLQEASLPLQPVDASDSFRIITSSIQKTIKIETIIPKQVETFPWSGHIGIRLASQVARLVKKSTTTLLFTNTRAQAEIWYQEIQKFFPDDQDRLAIHHGSLSKKDRGQVEGMLKQGEILCAVCTASLDLGIDFPSVDQVIQVGSPKGIARLAQRAGRAGHQPGEVSRLVCVPTNALELVEFAAAREAWEGQAIEAKELLEKPLDVLVQHLVTLVIGEPARPEDLRDEIQSCHTYRDLTDEEWEWAIDFITNGGPLAAYPQYRKAMLRDGKLHVDDKRIMQLHKMNIGTITSDSAILIKYKNGQVLGTIEESFMSRLKPGKQFVFAGKRLELVRFHKLMATVKNATRKARGNVPTWNGGRMPLSSELASAVAHQLRSPGAHDEMQAVRPILEIQNSWSDLPGLDSLLIEHTRTRDGEHLFCYPFAGRLVHEGIAALVAYRLTEAVGESIHVTQNDYGFSLTARGGLPLDEGILRSCFSVNDLTEDLEKCMNTAEMARRQFREIARVAGLIVPQFPGKHKNNREIQVSAKLLFEVFQRYDSENMLLQQASREILSRQLEVSRLKKTLLDINERPMRLCETERLTPMAFPLWADRLSAYLPAGDAATRLEKMLEQLQKATS